MNMPLRVTVESLRDTSDSLEDLASGLYNDSAGPQLTAAGARVGTIDSGSACREVGETLLYHAHILGTAVSAFAEKLDSAAFLYEHGDSAAAERIEFDPPEEEEKEIGDDPGEPGYDPINEYEEALHEAGLLDGPSDGFYREWLQNAADNDVPPEIIVEIAQEHDITPQSFDVLKGMERVTDNDGKTYFILPEDASAQDIRSATLMTYILNAGTGYGTARGNDKNDFAETPYTSDEVQRIIDRQEANAWSYLTAQQFDGRLATTPNGMLMGLGGNVVEDQLSLRGGSTVGDMYLVNIDNPADAAQQLRDIINSGQTWYSEQRPLPGTTIDLDRILHHEERHSQQWADLGFGDMVKQYGQKAAEEWLTKQLNPFETNAGASDGGYR